MGAAPVAGHWTRSQGDGDSKTDRKRPGEEAGGHARATPDRPGGATSCQPGSRSAGLAARFTGGFQQFSSNLAR